MKKHTDPQFLKKEAYAGAADLNTRLRFQERYRTHPQNWFRWVFNRFQLPAQARILELGCGSGHLWVENLSQLPQGWWISVTDFSPGMVLSASRSLPGGPHRFTFAVADAEAIPFPSVTFEAVIGIGLLDHINNRVAALTEIRRVLIPGGHFYTATGGRSHLHEIKELVQPFLPSEDIGGDPDRFGLENGEKHLSPLFSRVRLCRYPDQLIINQVEPLLAYVLSEPETRAALRGDKLAAFTRHLQSELVLRSEIRVTSEKGLFLAIK